MVTGLDLHLMLLRLSAYRGNHLPINYLYAPACKILMRIKIISQLSGGRKHLLERNFPSQQLKQYPTSI